MKESLYSLMKGDVKMITSTNCVLARLWMKLLPGMNIQPSNWDLYMMDYIAKCEKLTSKKEAQNLKGNLPKRLERDTLTFKVFCRGISIPNFHRMEFNLILTKDGVTKVIGIDIPQTFDDKSGVYLKTLWVMLTKEFDHAVKDWKRYLERYRDALAKVTGTNQDSITGTLPRSLNAEELTWNTFYQGVLIHEFDAIDIELIVYRRSMPNRGHAIKLAVKQH